MNTDKKDKKETNHKALNKFQTRYIQTAIIIAFYICVHLCSSVDNIFAQGLPVAAPNTIGMSAEKLNQIDALVTKDIADKKLPGAVVVIGHKGKIVYRKAFGNRALVPTVEKMTIDTIFDIASLTKVVATTTSIMILVERGQIRLNDTIGKFIPEIADENVKKITIQQLMTHVTGFAPDFDLREKWTGREGMLNALYKEKLRQPSGTKFVYSDINFIVLGEIVKRASGKSDDKFYDLGNFSIGNIFSEIKMTNTGFRDIEILNPELPPNIKRLPLGFNQLLNFAPTENIKGQNSYLGSKFEGDDKTGNQILRGQVHDPTAYRMGGVAGHAGLFSTGDDLAQILSDAFERRNFGRQARFVGKHDCANDRADCRFGRRRDARTRLGHQHRVFVESRRTFPARLVWTHGFYGNFRSGLTAFRKPSSSFCQTAFTPTAKATFRRFAPKLQPSRLRQSKTRRLKRFGWRKISIGRKSRRRWKSSKFKVQSLKLKIQQSAIQTPQLS